MTLRDEATLRDELGALTPRLRRYARALTSGSAAGSETADDLVHATLMRALGARHIGAAADLPIRLYATVTQLNRELAVVGRQARVAGAGPVLVNPGRNSSAERQSRLTAGLNAMSLDAREALLLVGLEGFGHAEAARILRISRGVLMERLTQARTTLDSTLQSMPRRIAGPARRPGPGQTGAPTPKRQQPGHLRLVSSRP